MSWLSDKLVSDKKSDCYEEVSCHGTHEHHNFCLGLNHMGKGLDRETGHNQGGVFAQFMTVTMHGRGNLVYCYSEF